MDTNADMTHTKKCPVCGGDAGRLGRLGRETKTFFWMASIESDPKTNEDIPMPERLGFMAYGCPKCGHVDLYAFKTSGLPP